jgi:hypothetical protein
MAAVVLMATSVFAQTPNFAGKWTPDAEKNQAAGGGGGRGGGGRMGGGGGDMTITQDAKQLVIARTTPNGETKTTYNLDGSESKNQMMGRGGQAMEQVSKAKFEGNKLVITTTTANGESTASWYMEGDHLVNERTGGQGNVIKTYYKKAM